MGRTTLGYVLLFFFLHADVRSILMVDDAGRKRHCTSHFPRGPLHVCLSTFAAPRRLLHVGRSTLGFFLLKSDMRSIFMAVECCKGVGLRRYHGLLCHHRCRLLLLLLLMLPLLLLLLLQLEAMMLLLLVLLERVLFCCLFLYILLLLDVCCKCFFLDCS